MYLEYINKQDLMNPLLILMDTSILCINIKNFETKMIKLIY